MAWDTETSEQWSICNAPDTGRISKETYYSLCYKIEHSDASVLPVTPVELPEHAKAALK